MRRVIKKNRVLEWKLLETTDATSFGNVATIQWTASNFAPLNYTPLGDANGELVIRSTIKVENLDMNTRVQVIDNISSTINNLIGDNKYINYYGESSLVKELWHRITRKQLNKIQIVNTMGNIGYFSQSIGTNFLDISDFKNIKAVITNNSTGRGNNREIKGLLLNTKLEHIFSLSNTANPMTTLNLSFHNDLKTLQLENGKLESFSLSALAKPNITKINLAKNKLTTIDTSDLVSLKYLNLSYNDITTVDLSASIDLEVLLIEYCKLTSLNLTNNVNIKELKVNDNPNIGEIIGINGLVKLERLTLGNNTVLPNYIYIDNFPLLKFCYVPTLSANIIWGVLTNLNLGYIYIKNSKGFVDTLNLALYPNVKTLLVGFNSSDLLVTNIQALSGNINNYLQQCKLDNLIDFTTWTSDTLEISNSITGCVEITLPIKTHTELRFNNNGRLEKINNLNAGGKGVVRIQYTKLIELNIGNISVLTELSFGGGAESFTSIGGFATKSNSIITFNMYPCAFTFTGEIKGNFNNASYLRLDNENCEIAYSVTTPAFPTNMRKVYIRPKNGYGLASAIVGRGQVAQLIIDLSTKSWLETTPLGNPIPDGGYRIIDLRGNCKAPTPSGALTTALNLLTSKGVTVLTN